MKKQMWFLLLCFLPILAMAWEVTLEPRKVRAGEWAYLIFRTEKGEALPDPGRDLPEIKSISFARNESRQSTRISIVHDKRSHIVEKSIPFLAEKEGEYTIPLKKLPKWTSSTPESFTFRVLPSASLSAKKGGKGEEKENSSSSSGTVTWEEALLFRIEVPDKKKTYFPGEEIELDFSLYILRGLQARIGSYPAVRFGSGGKNLAVFRDYRKVNSENPDFEGVYRTSGKVNGRLYDIYTFRTAILPSLAGKLPISASVNTLVTLPEENRRSRGRGGFFDDEDDPFFSSFFSRERRITKVVTAPEIQLDIAELPPVKKGAFATELVGNFTFSAALAPEKGWKTGEVGNLTLTITGQGNMDFLKVPPFAAPGFRAYPPEVKKSGSKVEINYLLIPLEVYREKEKNIFLPPLAWFDPSAGKYRYFNYAERMEIGKGPFAVSGTNVEPPLPAASGKEVEKRPPAGKKESDDAPEELLYLKKWSGKEPATGKLLSFSILLAIFGLILPLPALLLKKYKKDPSDSFARRKKEASGSRKGFFRDLEKVPPGELGDFAGVIASQIADTFSLPPGSDLKAAADFVKKKDPALAGQLEKIAESSWMPQFTAFTEDFRKELVKRLKKLLVLLLSACLASAAVEVSGQENSSLFQEEAQAKAAYDNGDFARSAKLYSLLLKKVKKDPVLYYNCGNAYVKMGAPSIALAYYERAMLLAPRDRDLRQNLAFVRKKLFLPSLEKTPENPLEVLGMIRDRFLPEEWGFLLSLGIFVAGLSLGIGIYLSSGVFLKWGTSAGAVLILLSLSAILTLLPAKYSGKEGVVTGENPVVYTLPSPKAAPSESFTLRKGEFVEIREKREKWARIQLGHQEGWIPVEKITPLWEKD